MISVVITATSHANFQQQWEYALSNFQPNAVYAFGGLPMTGTVVGVATEITSPSELPEDHTLVLLAPQNGLNLQGDEPLSTFVHPENVVYWFGDDSRHIQAEVFNDRAPDHLVYINTDTNDQMYSFSSYLVVAWDRRCKA